MNTTLSFTSDAFKQSGLSNPPTVVAAYGVEAISAPYEWTLHMLGDAGTSATALDSLVGASGTLTVGDDDDAPQVHGVVASVELVGRAGDRPVFRAALVPRLWLLGQCQRTCAFTNANITDIIAEVLKGADLAEKDFAFDLSETYAKRDFVCQYQESDLAFVSRWMEREGLYYFFDHSGDAEKLVITDSRATQEPFKKEAVRFFGLGGGSGAGECLRTWTSRRRVVPKAVALTDHDAQHPGAKLAASAAAAAGAGGDVQLHGLGFVDATRGARLATVHADRLLSAHVTLRGEGTTRALRSGYTFKLEDHPDDALDGEHLVTRLEHFALAADVDDALRRTVGFDQPDMYRVEVSAIPAAAQYRAPATTPWPRVVGFEGGVIDAPGDGDAAPIDEEGRYKVKLRFDQSELSGGKASAWLRMMQPHAGAPEGFHFPLRKGTEVVIGFVGGDPDQPVIRGAIPNAVKPSPVNAHSPYANVIHTAGENRVELFDARGKQFVKLSSPTAGTSICFGAQEEGEDGISIETEGDSEEETEGDDEETIHGTKRTFIYGGEAVDFYGGKFELVIGGDAALIVGGVSDTVVGLNTKVVVGAEEKTVIGLAPIASQVDIVGFSNTNVLGGSVTNVLGPEMKFVGGGTAEVIVGGESKTVLGGVVETIGGLGVSETILGLESSTVIGGSSVLLGGLEQSTAVAGKMSNTIGVEMGTLIGVESKSVIGMVLNTVLGAKVGFALAELVTECIDLSSEETKEEDHTLELEDGGAYIAQHSFSSED